MPLIDSLTRVIQASLSQMRWLSVAAMVLGALVSPQLLGPTDLMTRLLGYAAIIGLINLGLLLAEGSLGGGTAPLLLAPLAQLSFDLLAWGGYIFLSGGATNPLISLFLPLVAIGALILPPRQAWLLALGALLIYSFLWYFYVPLHIADFARAGTLHLFGMWLVFALSEALVVGFILQLSASLRQRDQALATAREQALRDDWLIALGSQAAAAAHALGTPLASLNVLADDLLDDARLPTALAAEVQAMKTQLHRCKETLHQLRVKADQALDEQASIRPAKDWLKGLLNNWRSQYPGTRVDFDPGNFGANDLVPGNRDSGSFDPAGFEPSDFNPAGFEPSDFNPAGFDPGDLDSAPLDLDQDREDLLLATDSALERALTNLLDNAVKAGASQVRVNVAVQEGTLAVQIRDNGPGLTPEALAAFARHQPLDSAAGLGVGLLLGRAALERRGGSLSLHPADGGPDDPKGTLAELRLPRVNATLAKSALSYVRTAGVDPH